jgi:hypothetical protein
MKKIRTLLAVLALAASLGLGYTLTATNASADCCPNGACCKDGAACCNR